MNKETNTKKKVVSKTYSLGLFSYQDVLRLGISRRELEKKLKDGNYIRLDRGLYLDLNTRIPPEHIDFIVSYYKFKKECVISGLTALFYHGLIEQAPHQIWVIVPEHIRTRESKYRLVRVKEVSQKATLDFEHFKMATIERAIVEAFKYSSKIGLRTAISSLVMAIKTKKTTMAKIMNTAKEMGFDRPLRNHWEVIIGATQDK